MRSFMIAALALLVIALPKSASAATTTSATPVRIQYVQSNVTTSAWTPVVASTPKAIKGVAITNGSLSPIIVGFGAAGSEVSQLYVPGIATNVGYPSTTYYPLVAGQNLRVSIKAFGSTANSGEGLFTFFYN